MKSKENTVTIQCGINYGEHVCLRTHTEQGTHREQWTHRKQWTHREKWLSMRQLRLYDIIMNINYLYKKI